MCLLMTVVNVVVVIINNGFQILNPYFFPRLALVLLTTGQRNVGRALQSVPDVYRDMFTAVGPRMEVRYRVSSGNCQF